MTRARLADQDWEFLGPFLPVDRFCPYPERLREQFEGVIWRFRTGSLGSVFHAHAAIQVRMSFSSAWTLLWTPRRIRLLVSSANHRSTRFSQDDPVGVKCRWEREWATSQVLIAGVLWIA